MIQGAAYEWKCPGAPKRISLYDGYLTVMFGNGGHFHLCIGENRGSESNPTPPELRAHRRPSRAQIFRGFDADAKPLTWGFEMWNGKGENGLSIFFPSPFLGDDDSLLDSPDFSRLSAWRSIAKRWLGRSRKRSTRRGRDSASRATSRRSRGTAPHARPRKTSDIFDSARHIIKFSANLARRPARPDW